MAITSPLERAEERLTLAAKAVDDAARAMAEAASQADRVAPSAQEFRRADRQRVAAAARHEFTPLPLESGCHLAVEYGLVGAQLHDWANALHVFNSEASPS